MNKEITKIKNLSKVLIDDLRENTNSISTINISDNNNTVIIIISNNIYYKNKYHKKITKICTIKQDIFKNLIILAVAPIPKIINSALNTACIFIDAIYNKYKVIKIKDINIHINH